MLAGPAGDNKMIDLLKFLKDLNYQAWCIKGGPKEVEDYKLEIIIKNFEKNYSNFEILDHMRFLNRYEWRFIDGPKGEWWLRRVDKSKIEGPRDYFFSGKLINIFEWLMEIR